jgi:hypothetical protein
MQQSLQTPIVLLLSVVNNSVIAQQTPTGEKIAERT